MASALTRAVRQCPGQPRPGHCRKGTARACPGWRPSAAPVAQWRAGSQSRRRRAQARAARRPLPIAHAAAPARDAAGRLLRQRGWKAMAPWPARARAPCPRLRTLGPWAGLAWRRAHMRLTVCGRATGKRCSIRSRHSASIRCASRSATTPWCRGGCRRYSLPMRPRRFEAGCVPSFALAKELACFGLLVVMVNPTVKEDITPAGSPCPGRAPPPTSPINLRRRIACQAPEPSAKRNR